MLAVGKTLLREHNLFLALRILLHVAWLGSVAWLAISRRPAYLRHRELLATVAAVHVVVVALDGGINGGDNLFLRHRGNPLLLLLFLMVRGQAEGLLRRCRPLPLETPDATSVRWPSHCPAGHQRLVLEASLLPPHAPAAVLERRGAAGARPRVGAWGLG